MSASIVPLALLTTVSAVSFVQVFGEVSSLVPSVLAGLWGHAAMRGVDGERAYPLATAVALVVGFGLLMGWAVAGHTTAYGVPTAETVEVLGERLSDGFGAIRTADVPVGPHNGIVLVAALGVFVAALAGDWVAFHARAVLSACIPAATMFTLTATLGDPRHEAALAVAFVVAALGFVLTHAPAQAGEAHSWFTVRTGRPRPGPVLRAGVPLIVVAAVAAPVLGPRLPEARSAGLIDLKPGPGGPRTRVTVSPLVDIRDRLTQSPPVEVFTVRAAQPAYWRMAALETYDGQIWSSLADYDRADRELPADSEVVPTMALTQEYAVSALSQFWLPAAYRPMTVDLPGARVNPDSLTLLTDRPTSNGLVYRVESAVPSYGPADLTGETGRVPERLVPFLALPGGVPDPVADLARDVTGGRRTVYEKSLALQQFFRQEFDYREEVPPGHSGDRMVDFLLVSRAGFCEQFSASFAVMARSLGIPARVAVGFTPGVLDPTGAYHVSTGQAHAWPEVYIDPYGWVAFEPTPGRFNPSPANHTGTYNPEAQQALPTQPVPSPATTAPPAVPEAPVPPTAPPADQGGGADGGTPAPVQALMAAAVALAGTLLGGWGLMEYRRHRRRRHLAGLDPAGSILGAWDEVVEQLRLDGLALHPSATPREAARVAGTHEPEVAAPMASLRELVDVAAYSSHDPAPTDATTAWDAAREIVAVLERDDSPRRRLRRRLTAPPV